MWAFVTAAFTQHVFKVHPLLYDDYVELCPPKDFEVLTPSTYDCDFKVGLWRFKVNTGHQGGPSSMTESLKNGEIWTQRCT